MVTEAKGHVHKKAVQDMEKLPEDLLVDIVEHTLPKSERSCQACGHGMHVIDKNKRETLKLISAIVVIERHIQNVYGCRTVSARLSSIRRSSGRLTRERQR